MKSEVATFIVDGLVKQGSAAGAHAEILVQTLSSLGLDSLDFMELLNDIEERFDVRIEDDAVTASSTVGDLITFVEAKVAARASISPVDRA
jgi:acyl carrier protein